jgi:hypothetical protein
MGRHLVNPPTANLSGYVVYLAAIFLPGLGLGELLDIWPDDRSLADVLAYAFGLGLAVDTLVLFVRTSGFTIAGAVLKGMDLDTVYLLIVLGLVFFLASAAWRRRLRFPVRPQKVDFALLVPILVVVIIVSLYFAKYPFFPRNESEDFQNHAQYVLWLIDGTFTSVPNGILYYGVHYQLASALLLVGGEPLVTVQRTMALLVVLSPLLFYAGARALFSRRLPAIVVTLIYALSGTIWFVSAFVTGLFPNLFGVMAVMFFVTTYAALLSRFSVKRYWIPFLLSLVMLYFSHFTALTIFPALLLLPFVQYARERKDTLRYVVPSIVLVVPVAIVLVAYPSILSLLLRIAEASGGLVGISTTLSGALSPVPILSFIAADIYDDIAFVFLFAFTVVYLWKGVRGQSSMAWVPLFWFATIVAATAFTTDVWRYSYEALAPLTLMAGYGLFALLPKPGRAPRGLRTRTRSGSTFGRYLTLIAILAILLIPIVATSWAEVSTADALSNPGDSATAQNSVYTAMYWLKSNTPNDSVYFSATDWRFTYANFIISHRTYSPPEGDCYTDPQSTVSAALNNSANYLIVTNLETCALPPGLGNGLWDSMQPASNLTLVYQDIDVKIFQIG